MSTRNPPRKPKSKPLGGRLRHPVPEAAPAVEPTPRYGIDPALVDPLRVLSRIANDAEAPAQARVAAYKALLTAGVGSGAPAQPDTPAGRPDAAHAGPDEAREAQLNGHDEADDMPIVETYRGVGIHAFQPAERIERVVKPAIDAAFARRDGPALLAYARDPQHAPEARLPAAARIEAIWQLAAENREVRPKVHPDKARSATSAPDSLHWADPWLYGTLLEPGPGPGESRPRRDAACQAALEQAQKAWQARDRQKRLVGA